MSCLNKNVVSIKVCRALFCREKRPHEDDAILPEKRVTLKKLMDDNDSWGRKLEELTRDKNILPEISLNEEENMSQMLPSSDKSLWELLKLHDQNLRKLRDSSKMTSVARPEENTLSSMLTSLMKRKRNSSLLTSVIKRRWSQEVAECIKLECSHMGSLQDIVPCQENCRAKW